MRHAAAAAVLVACSRFGAQDAPEPAPPLGALRTPDAGVLLADAAVTRDAAAAEPDERPGKARWLTLPEGALDPFFTQLAAAEAKEPAGRALVTVFGDSHTAGDAWTSRLRVQLQSRFGDGGRGFVLPGKPPVMYYGPGDVSVASSGKWQVAEGKRRLASEPFGLAGVRTYADKRGPRAEVGTCADCRTGHSAASFELFYWREPKGGSFRWRLDGGKWQSVSTATPHKPVTAPGPAQVKLAASNGPHRVELEVDKAPVSLFGMALETQTPGALVENLGTVGLRAVQLEGWDWSVIGPQLAARAPALVVIQFGTNEADQRSLDLAATEEVYVRLIGKIKAAAPGASVLLLGPPDFGVRDRGKLCDPPPPRKLKKGKKKPRPPVLEGPPAPGCEWHTNPRLLDVIATQKRAAARAGVAFFDTLAAMGGPDRMDVWVATGVAYRDHVHFLRAGYELWADVLITDLLIEYDAWRVRTRLER